MSISCHRCGAIDPSGHTFCSERIPFRGRRIYCPPCHLRLEENFLSGIMLCVATMGLASFVSLLLNPASKFGHVGANLVLIQLIVLPSILLHEFAHALVARWSGLIVLGIWIGRGRTLFHANILGFPSEFKIIPLGGLTFLTHGAMENLRRRYFLAILAGPMMNASLLVAALLLTSWRTFDFENRIEFAALIVLAQSVILVENLLPYRIQTALGTVPTDGRSLWQLLFSKAPDLFNSLGNLQSTTRRRT